MLSGVGQRCLCRKPTVCRSAADDTLSSLHATSSKHYKELQTMAAVIEPFVCLIDLPVSFQLAHFCLCKSIKDRFEELPSERLEI